jgi:hypothetical protein
MSVDALTFDVVKGAENVSGKLFERVAVTTFSTGYPTGGYTFPRALNTQYGQLGIADLLGVQEIATNTAAITYFARWDSEAEKLVLINDGTGTEVADNTDVHLLAVTLKLIGTR